MEPLEYLRTFRRRWRLVVIVTLVSLAVAVGAGSGAGGTPTAEDIREAGGYTAVHVLTTDDPGRLQGFSLLARSEEVAVRTARELGMIEGDDPAPAGLAQVGVDGERGVLRVVATDNDPDRAREVADTYAAQVIAYVDERLSSRRQSQVDRLGGAVVEQQDRIRELEGRLAQLDPASVEGRLAEADRSALVDAYQTLQNRLAQLRAETVVAEVYTLEPAIASLTGSGQEAEDGGALAAPVGLRTRAQYGLLAGLILGLGLALLVERVDVRVHTRRDAERAFQLPVVAEVPRNRRRWWHRGHGSGAYDPDLDGAYGRLRVALLHMPRWVLGPRMPAMPEPTGTSDGESHGAMYGSSTDTGVVLVTSAVRGEGRTSVCVNLAASLAGTGKRVALVDCDHDNPGLAQSAAGRPVHASSDWKVWESGINGVKVVPAPVDLTPGERAAIAAEVIDAAREHADVVVVDTGPLLSTIDAATLVPIADSVVVVARDGRVTDDDAREVRDLLANLHAPVTGIVLISQRGHAPRGRTARPRAKQARGPRGGKPLTVEAVRAAVPAAKDG